MRTRLTCSAAIALSAAIISIGGCATETHYRTTRVTEPQPYYGPVYGGPAYGPSTTAYYSPSSSYGYARPRTYAPTYNTYNVHEDVRTEQNFRSETNIRNENVRKTAVKPAPKAKPNLKANPRNNDKDKDWDKDWDKDRDRDRDRNSDRDRR